MPDEAVIETTIEASSNQLWVENERIPESYYGSFNYLPPEAFSNFMTRRTVKVPWSERFDTIKTILGWAEYDSESDPARIIRYLPWNDHDDQLLIAFKCDIVAKSYEGQTINLALPPMKSGNLYEFAWIDISFAAPRFNLGDREVYAAGVEPQSIVGTPSQVGSSYELEHLRFCTKEVKPGVALYTEKMPAFRFNDGALEQIIAPLPLTVSYEDTVVNWWAVPLDAVPYEEISAAVGKVNDATLALPDIPRPGSYAAETVKLQTYKFTDCWLTSGGEDDVPVRGTHITYYFKFRPKNLLGKGGWNDYPDQNGELRPVVRIGDPTKKLYDTADFSKLFRARITPP